VIEIDGEIHFTPENILYDQFRTEELASLGLKVIRFKNEEVLENISNVLMVIRMYLTPGPLEGEKGKNSTR